MGIAYIQEKIFIATLQKWNVWKLNQSSGVLEKNW